MKKICVITGTRSEYGLLAPLIKKLQLQSEFKTEVVVTGSHLSAEYGYTYKCIEEDGILINKKIDILSEDNSAVGITKTMGVALEKFGKYFQESRPDLIVILGDRYEIFAVATAAAVLNIPIAHLHGGEVTLGAYDEFFRHGITKMSSLHFTSCEEHRKRVIQLGEDPHMVYNVGAIGIENIKEMKLLSRDELSKSINFNLDGKYALVTFHPVTLEKQSISEQCKEVIQAIRKSEHLKFIITKANADDGGRIINEMLEQLAKEFPQKISLHTSLGQLRYLSAMKYCSFVLGNSSSGLIEAPSFGIPTINIGNRQKGRMHGKSVINCLTNEKDILKSIELAQNDKWRNTHLNEENPYGTGNVSDKIIRHVKDFLNFNSEGIVKTFYDIPFEVN